MSNRQIVMPIHLRICEGRDREIQRNLAIFDEKPYPCGCLKKTRSTSTDICMNLLASFRTQQLLLVTDRT
ncbi:MAG: hypothetical protein NWF13_03280 [Candidatus Bathyarchaeota archaeon]|nr:hypothetical protein [Candidatus Bathyarchaeota archaeon]